MQNRPYDTRESEDNFGDNRLELPVHHRDVKFTDKLIKECRGEVMRKYKYLDHEPEMVCLIGSSRFGSLQLQVMKEETLKGNIVLMMGLFGHETGLDMHSVTKKMLDELYLVKIDKSSIVIVVNGMVPWCSICNEHRLNNMGCTGECAWKGDMKPYIGESTRNELNYAMEHKKTIRFLNPPDEIVKGNFLSTEPKEIK